MEGIEAMTYQVLSMPHLTRRIGVRTWSIVQSCLHESCFDISRRFGDCEQIPYGISFVHRVRINTTFTQRSSFTLSPA